MKNLEQTPFGPLTVEVFPDSIYFQTVLLPDCKYDDDQPIRINGINYQFWLSYKRSTNWGGETVRWCYNGMSCYRNGTTVEMTSKAFSKLREVLDPLVEKYTSDPKVMSAAKARSLENEIKHLNNKIEELLRERSEKITELEALLPLT